MRFWRRRRLSDAADAQISPLATPSAARSTGYFSGYDVCGCGRPKLLGRPLCDRCAADGWQQEQGPPPTLHGSLVGFRNWLVFPHEGDFVLSAAGRVPPVPMGIDPRMVNGVPLAEYRWRRGGFTEAVCDMGAHHGTPAPVHLCSCGLYARHTLRPVQASARALPAAQLVTGMVQAHGRVEVHADGFRAQFARPVALLTDRTGAAELTRKVAAAWELEVLDAADATGIQKVVAAHGQLVSPELRQVDSDDWKRCPACQGQAAWRSVLGRYRCVDCGYILLT